MAWIIMDNFEMTIVARGSEALVNALNTIGLTHRKATSWRVDGQRLIFYWGTPDVNMSVMPFLLPLEPHFLLPTIELWLEQQSYGREPDHDGDNAKGWKLTTEDVPFNALFSIKPEWAIIGK